VLRSGHALSQAWLYEIWRAILVSPTMESLCDNGAHPCQIALCPVGPFL
jgi:hypothetical protein